MSMDERAQPEKPGGFAARIDRLITRIAVLGGVLSLGFAALVVISVLGRWLFASPIEGDFEFVKMGTALAVFSFLPLTQIRRGNIMVDTFTLSVSPQMRDRIDAIWDICYAGFACLLAYGLAYGAIEARASGETTMQLQIVLWPAIGICSLLSALLVVAALFSAADRVRRGA